MNSWTMESTRWRCSERGDLSPCMAFSVEDILGGLTVSVTPEVRLLKERKLAVETVGNIGCKCPKHGGLSPFTPFSV